MFKKVKINGFIFVMDIFCIGPASKSVILGITACHQASFCLLHSAG